MIIRFCFALIAYFCCLHYGHPNQRSIPFWLNRGFNCLGLAMVLAFHLETVETAAKPIQHYSGIFGLLTCAVLWLLYSTIVAERLDHARS